MPSWDFHSILIPFSSQRSQLGEQYRISFCIESNWTVCLSKASQLHKGVVPLYIDMRMLWCMVPLCEDDEVIISAAFKAVIDIAHVNSPSKHLTALWQTIDNLQWGFWLFLHSNWEYAYHYHFIMYINKAMCLPHVSTTGNSNIICLYGINSNNNMLIGFLFMLVYPYACCYCCLFYTNMLLLLSSNCLTARLVTHQSNVPDCLRIGTSYELCLSRKYPWSCKKKHGRLIKFAQSAQVAYLRDQSDSKKVMQYTIWHLFLITWNVDEVCSGSSWPTFKIRVIAKRACNMTLTFDY